MIVQAVLRVSVFQKEYLERLDKVIVYHKLDRNAPIYVKLSATLKL